jgi:FkbM family methyltransferase|tara:strand:+ start:103 stop:807 length:705 start_codon:yes stop_codon:yes gene_type:complete
MDILKGFNWGWMSYDTIEGKNHKATITQEIEDSAYEKYFEVEKGDIVLDCGASVGPFSYSIKGKKPKRIIGVEPSQTEIPTLTTNMKGSNFTLVPYAISDQDGEKELLYIFESSKQNSAVSKTLVKTLKFTSLLKQYDIKKIDFFKTDCEGGEYDIFNSENIWWIKNNIKKITGEWHLSTPELKAKFRAFRDTYLRLFPNHMVSAINGVDIKWDLWNDHFIEYYTEVFIYIDNR